MHNVVVLVEILHEVVYGKGLHVVVVPGKVLHEVVHGKGGEQHDDQLHGDVEVGGGTDFMMVAPTVRVEISSF